MIRTLVTAGVLAAVSIPVTATASTAPAFLHGAVGDAVTIKCADEDSLNCYWNEPPGHPFYSIRVGSKQCIVYTNRKFNRQNGHCFKL